MSWLTKYFRKAVRGSESAQEPEPTPPPGVWVLDGHWWLHLGREDYSDNPPEFRQYARDIYRCLRCWEVSKTYANPPKVWLVQNKKTGEFVQSGDADTHRHVVKVCPGRETSS